MDIIILKSFLPEIFFSFAILTQLVHNIRIVNNIKYNFPIINKEVFVQTIFILLVLLCFYNDLKIEGFLSTFTLINDEGSRVAKILFIVVCTLSLVIVYEANKIQKINFFEFYSIFLLSILGLLLMINSSDLIIFYLAMETQALCFYILASLNRNSIFSIEAGLKYFISGSFMSGFYLLGCSFIYGSLGTINLNSLNLLLSFEIDTYDETLKYLAIMGVIMITSTILFKLACAPFHFWSPDVYDGAPIGSTLVFSVVSKLPIIFFFLRWINSTNLLFESISTVLLVFGLFSTVVGTFFAMSQKRLKRLIIYSSIAQTGFLVVALSVNSLESSTAVYFFLIVYLITSILVWGHFVIFYLFSSKINAFYMKGVESLFISSLSNLFKFNGLWSFSIVLIFFSIGGVPPLTGFLSKILIVYSLITVKNLVAAILLIVISSISVYYYIRMIKVVYFEPKLESVSQEFKIISSDKELQRIYLLFSSLLTLIILIFYFPTLSIMLCQYMVINLIGF
jgi:NADH-quinone oxidoreductase subunit N